MRKFQSLAIFDQSGVEGNNEFINRQATRLPKSTGHRYKDVDIAKGEEHLAAIAEDRKRRQKSIARTIFEMCEAETWDAEYSLGTKGKLKEQTTTSITANMKEIDKAIEAGEVRDWKTEFVPTTAMYMIMETLKAVRGSRSRRNPDIVLEPLGILVDEPKEERATYYDEPWPLQPCWHREGARHADVPSSRSHSQY